MIETLIEKGYAYEKNERYITVQESSKIMVNYPIRTLTIFSQADVPFL